jgi:hypothetical protein
MTALAALAGAFLLLYAPGLAICASVRLRGLAPWALAPALSLAACGAGTVVARPLGLPWGWPVALASTALACVIAWPVGRLFPIAAPRALPRWSGRQWAGVGAAAAAATAWSLGALLLGQGGVGRPMQRRDRLFHGDLVRWIVETGDASPLDGGLLDHPGGGATYYPSAVHALAALLAPGTGVAAALNAMFDIGTTVVWVVGCVYLARVLFPRRPALAVAAAGLAGLFQSTPSALTDLVPSAVGVAVLPALVGWSVQLARVVTIRTPGKVTRAAVLAVGVAGASLAHPQTLFSYLVVALPIAAYVVRMAVTRAWRAGRRVAAVVVCVAVAGGVAVAGVAVLALPSVRLVAAFEGWEAAQPLPLALASGLFDWTTSFDPGPGVALGLAALAGAVIVLRRRRRRWLLVSYALALVLYVNAAAGLGPLTGLWYGDRQRLGVLVTVASIPLAAIGITSAWRIVRRGGRWRRAGRVAVAAVLVAGTVSTGFLAGLRPARVAEFGFALASTPQRPRFFDAAEWAMINRLGGELEPGAAVLGNPANGSAYVYATAGVPVVLPTVAGTWGADRWLLIEHLGEWETNPRVCEVMGELNVRYLYSDAQTYYNITDYAHLQQAIESLDPATLREVDHGGTATVYEFTGCAADRP